MPVASSADCCWFPGLIPLRQLGIARLPVLRLLDGLKQSNPVDKGWTCLLQALNAAVDETAPMHALRQHVSLSALEQAVV